MAMPQIEMLEDVMCQMRSTFDMSDYLPLYDDSLFRELFKPRRVYLQRPHTDDMMQMCADLGIDVPIFQPISYDGKAFRFQPTAAVMVDAEGFTPVSYSQMYVVEESPWA